MDDFTDFSDENFLILVEQHDGFQIHTLYANVAGDWTPWRRHTGQLDEGPLRAELERINAFLDKAERELGIKIVLQ